MQKKELKALAREIYEHIVTTIDEQEHTTIQQLIDYMQNAVVAMEGVEDDDITTLEYAKSTFFDAYKDIADNGLMNYQTTNGKFLDISNQQSKIINDCREDHVDVDDILSKFENIQLHMVEEVKRANGVICDLSQQVKNLETKSNIDSLTKVFNRRALSAYLSSVCDEGNSNFELNMLMIDLDDFKQINDVHGHIAGDKILIFVSNILKHTLRDGDKIFRYGGEEFIVMLNRTDDNDCMHVADRILELIRVNNLIYKGTTLKITASMGVTKFTNGDTPDSFMERADKALYKAKDNGKNQIYTLTE